MFSRPTLVRATLGSTVTLAPGQTADFEGGALKLLFSDVSEDSRCPRDVVCITAGHAVARVSLESKGQRQDTSLEVVGSTSKRESVLGRFQLQYDITPYPVSTKRIAKSDYRLSVTATD